jgi:hypothetical protein
MDTFGSVHQLSDNEIDVDAREHVGIFPSHLFLVHQEI